MPIPRRTQDNLKKELLQSIVASGGGNAVQVMTVHKAKGLAFPVAMVVAGTNLVRSVRGGVPVNLPSGVVDPIPAVKQA